MRGNVNKILSMVSIVKDCCVFAILTLGRVPAVLVC